MKVFDDSFVPGALRVAILKTLITQTLHSSNELDLRMSIAEKLYKEQRKHSPAQKIWFELKAEGKRHYISLIPGEYSENKPTEPNIKIVKVRLPKRKNIATKKAKLFVESLKNEPIKMEETRVLSEQLTRSLESKETLEKECRNTFQMVHKKLIEVKDESLISDLINSLYVKCYSTYSMSLETFANSVLIIELQVQTGCYLDENAFESSGGAVAWLIDFLANEDEKRLRTVGAIGNEKYETASNSLSSSLKKLSFEEFLEELRYSAMNFWCAFLIATAIENNNKNSQLKYKAIVAEEGWVCCTSGIIDDKFLFNKIEYIPRGISHLIVKNPNFEFEFVNQYSSHTKPYLPRHICHILLSIGKSMSGNSKLCLEAKETLKSIESRNDYLLFGTMDLYLLYYGLMTAYRALGEENAAMNYATKMAAQIVIFMKLPSSQ